MPHGGPDWGTIGPLPTVYTIEDLGELAARLGSIVTHDRRGNIIALDDFESGIEEWEIDGVPAGYAGVWTAERYRNGGFSLKLTTKNETNAWAHAYRGYPYPYPSRMGFEISFIYGESLKSIEMWNDIFDGSDYYKAYVRFQPATNRWQYWSSGGAWVNLDPAYDLKQLDRIFHTIKLVVDMTTGKYVHLIVNDHTFDMSTLDMRKTGMIVTHRLYTAFRIDADRDDYAYTYIDDFIITTNEP